MPYKTIKDFTKDDVPAGATGYKNETGKYYFAWHKVEDGVKYILNADRGSVWSAFTSSLDDRETHPIPMELLPSPTTPKLVPFYIEVADLTPDEMKTLWEALVATNHFKLDEAPVAAHTSSKYYPYPTYSYGLFAYFGISNVGSTYFGDEGFDFDGSEFMSYQEALNMLTSNAESITDTNEEEEVVVVTEDKTSSHDHTVHLRMPNLDDLLAQRAKDLRAELDTYQSKMDELKALEELIAKRSNL